MSLDLLSYPPLSDELRKTEESAGKVLGLINPLLLNPSNISEFYNALYNLPPTFVTLLQIEVIQARLTESLQGLIAFDCIHLLVKTLSETKSLTTTLNTLACEQIREVMRTIVQNHSLMGDGKLISYSSAMPLEKIKIMAKLPFIW
ncbi:hypothetical protein QUF82_00535 [Thiotrichales bacterium HSG14]|nr:hypothetical protein [Thiotrichales bacterium HSG14]